MSAHRARGARVDNGKRLSLDIGHSSSKNESGQRKLTTHQKQLTLCRQKENVDNAANYGADDEASHTSDRATDDTADDTTQLTANEPRRAILVVYVRSPVRSLAWPVGGHDHLNLPQILETVQLVQQLHQRALDFPATERTNSAAATHHSGEIGRNK